MRYSIVICFLVSAFIGILSEAQAKSPAFFVVGGGPKVFTVSWELGEIEIVEFDPEKISEVDFSTHIPHDIQARRAHYQTALKMFGVSSRTFHDLVPVNGPKKGFHIISRDNTGRLGAREILIDDLGYLNSDFPESGPDFTHLTRYVRGPSGFPGMVIMDRDFQLGFQAAEKNKMLLGSMPISDYSSVNLAYLSSGATWGTEERLLMAYVFGEMPGRVGTGVSLFRVRPFLQTARKGRKGPSTGTFFEGFELPESFEPVIGYPMFHSSDKGAQALLELYLKASRGECSAQIVVSADLTVSHE